MRKLRQHRAVAEKYCDTGLRLNKASNFVNFSHALSDFTAETPSGAAPANQPAKAPLNIDP
jgi:hypothetical protein